MVHLAPTWILHLPSPHPVFTVALLGVSSGHRACFCLGDFALAVLQSRWLFSQLCTRLAPPLLLSSLCSNVISFKRQSLTTLFKMMLLKVGQHSGTVFLLCFVFTGLLWVKHRSFGGLPPECWYSYTIQDYDQRICLTIQGLEEEFSCGWIQVLSHLWLYQVLVQLPDVVWYFKVSLSSVGLPWLLRW